MSQLPHIAAASLSLLWLIVHLVLGGRQIARPLRQAPDLTPVVRDTQYLCWHFTSVAIGAMAILFALAVILETPAYAVSATLLAAGFASVGIGIVVAIRGSHAVLPQGWLFVPVAALGLWGLM